MSDQLIGPLREQGNLPAGVAIAVGNAASAVRRAAFEPIPDVTGSGTTATVALQMTDGDGNPVAGEQLVALGVYEDELGETLAADQELGTAADGAFVSGADSNDAVVKTDADGAFSCTLTVDADGTYYVRASAARNGPPVDPRTSVVSATFTA